ncbi:GpE family phage tail protein [Salmonella enterica subsp. enterica]|nr:GpE family phage tail protein [Salmonella enterica subsp. enterica]
MVFVTGFGGIDFPPDLALTDDLMADIVMAHRPPSELCSRASTELITWREKALQRSETTMSNNLRLEVLLKAVDQSIRPLKSIQTASKTPSGDIRNTQRVCATPNGQARRKSTAFVGKRAQLAFVTGQALDKRVKARSR